MTIKYKSHFYRRSLMLSTLAAVLLAGWINGIPGGMIRARGSESESQRPPEHQPNSGSLQPSQVPPPEASAAKVPAGYRVEVVLKNLTYPTSVEFDDQGNMLVAEAGYSYGGSAVRPRLLQVSPRGEIRTLTEDLEGPVNDLLWHAQQLYISHRGKISVWNGRRVRDLITGLPSLGDHQNNQLSAGPDGKIYFGQGTASNSGVIGVDNYKMGWLKKHPRFHDIPARDIRIIGQEFTTENVLREGDQPVQTAAFHPFGREAPVQDLVRGQTKACGTILRMNADGSGLEVYAWGLRNPYGVLWTPDGKLYASENGFDVRGSRPIANDKEDLYEIKQGAWYGWPDFASGLPVTDPRFKPENRPQPQFLMAAHPPVEKPLMTFPQHSASTKLAVSPGEAFGQGRLFLAFFGHMTPMTGTVDEHGGHRVVRIDLESLHAETFFGRQDHHHGGQAGGQHGSGPDHASSGKQGSEGTHRGSGVSSAESGHSSQSGHATQAESITAGPRRLMDVVFSRDGRALYIVDFGSMVVKEKPMPIPRTGVIWRVTPQGHSAENLPPANLSVSAP